MRVEIPGSRLATSALVLLVVFLLSLVVAIGLGAYFLGGLVGPKSRNVTGFTVPPQTPYVSLANPPPAATRVARGTTPPPFPEYVVDRASSPHPAGVVSSRAREDATEPDAHARYSVRRSQRRL